VERLELARLLRRRIGDVFGTVDRARWVGLEEERRIIRSWVASELLDVLFKHLVPEQDHHQTEPRRHFWSRYTSKVERLWLLVSPKLRLRLARPDLQETLDKVGDIVELRALHGQDEQAILWMHLTGSQGTVSVIEGNANSTCRIRKGEWKPPVGHIVDYTADIVHGPFEKARKKVRTQVHRGAWDKSVRNYLKEFGVTR